MAKEREELVKAQKAKTWNVLEEFRKKKDAKGAADMIFGIIKENRDVFSNGGNAELTPEQEGNEDATKAFINGITDIVLKKPEPELSEIKPEYHAFVQALIREFSTRYVNAVIEHGRKVDEWVEKIRTGQVPNTELIRDEPETMKKLAHAIVVQQEQINITALQAYTELWSALYFKSIGGTDALTIASNDLEAVKAETLHRTGISAEKYSEYDLSFESKEPSTSIGYEVPGKKVQEGEPLFSKLPDYMEVIRTHQTEEELEAYEREEMLKKHKLDRFTQQVKGTVKASKHLLQQLDAENKPILDAKMELDEANEFTRKDLERFTHVGTDYVYNKFNAPTSEPSPAIVVHATRNLIDYSGDFKRNTLRVYNRHVKNNTADTPEGEKAKTMAVLAQNIYDLTVQIRGKADILFKAPINGFTINNDAKRLKYIDKYRKQKGFFVSGKLKEDAHTKELDRLTDTLRDSLANDTLDPQCYDKLILSVKEQKWLYQKMRAAAKKGNIDAYNRYSAEVTRLGQEIKTTITECKTYEDGDIYRSKVDGTEIDRKEVLKTLSKTVTKKFGDMKPSFESYMYKHTGKYAGNSENEMRDNMVKVLAAYTLKKLGKPFDVKEIHKVADVIRDMYVLNNDDAMIRSQKRLKGITKDVDSVLAAGEAQRRLLYDVKGDRYADYTRDMANLKTYMRSPDGRSPEYRAFYNAVKAASELEETTADMTPEQKASVYRRMNVDLIGAVRKYVKGKEKTRIQEKGNDAFANAMDTLSVISKYTKPEGQPMSMKVINVLAGINKIRKDEKLYDFMKFEREFGVARAKTTYDARMARQAGGARPEANGPRIRQ